MSLPGLGGGGGGGDILGGMLGSGGQGAGGGGGILSNNGGGMQLYNMPFIGGLFPNPNEQAKLQAIKQVGQNYGAYRPEMAQAYQNMIGSQLGALQPAQGALMQMYGGKPPPGPTISNPSPGGSPLPPPQPSSGGSPGGSSGGSGGGLGSLFGGLPGMGGMGGLPGMSGIGGLGGMLGGGGLPGFGGSSTGLPGPLGSVANASMNPFAGKDATHVADNMLTGGLASLLGGI